MMDKFYIDDISIWKNLFIIFDEVSFLREAYKD